MRVFVEIAGAQTHCLQNLPGLPSHLGRAAASDHGQGLADDARHGLARVERAIGVLKHHLKVAPCMAQFGGAQGIQVLAEQLHPARSGRLQSHHQTRQGGFA